MENKKIEFVVNGNTLSIKKENQIFEIRFNTNDELSCFLLKILLKKELIL